MDKFTQRVFLMELDSRCHACLQAVDDFNARLTDPATQRHLFRAAREFIVQAALVSKLLWPARGSSKESQRRASARAACLRQLLGISGPHPVQDRTLRDQIEHYDEKLDAWVAESPNRNMVKELIGPRSAVQGSGFTDGDIIEHYDPATKLLAFRGQPFDLQELVEGIVDVKRRANQVLGTLGRV